MSPPAKKASKARKTAKKAASRGRRKPAGGRGQAFGARGRRLWDEMVERADGERGLVLLEEACRTADRLDKLDSLLRGEADAWCRLVHDVRTEDYELRIDSALIEARQQATVLRLLVAALPLKEAECDGGDEDGWIDSL